MPAPCSPARSCACSAVVVAVVLNHSHMAIVLVVVVACPCLMFMWTACYVAVVLMLVVAMLGGRQRRPLARLGHLRISFPKRRLPTGKSGCCTGRVVQQIV